MARPRRLGARQPSGRLKRSPRGDQAFTLAAWKRCKAAGEHLAAGPYIGTELGRLGFIGDLDDIEVAAGFKVAAVYGSFDRSLGLRPRSPAYAASYGGGSATPDDGAAAKLAFEALQEEISIFSQLTGHDVRAELEHLCVDDRPIPGSVIRVKALLASLARQWRIAPERKARQQRKAKQPSTTPHPTFDVLELSELGRALIFECYQRAADIKKVTLDWSDAEWQTINNFRVCYAQGRSEELFPNDQEWDSWIKAAEDALAKMLRFTECGDETSDHYWLCMGAGHPEFERDSVRQWVKAFRERSKAMNAAHMLANTKQAQLPRLSGDSFTRLVTRLADHFQSKGLDPTASDMYTRQHGKTNGKRLDQYMVDRRGPHHKWSIVCVADGAIVTHGYQTKEAAELTLDMPDPSPFVALVGIVISTLPDKLLPSANSLAAFSKAVSRNLAKRN